MVGPKNREWDGSGNADGPLSIRVDSLIRSFAIALDRCTGGGVEALQLRADLAEQRVYGNVSF